VRPVRRVIVVLVLVIIKVVKGDAARACRRGCAACHCRFQLIQHRQEGPGQRHMARTGAQSVHPDKIREGEGLTVIAIGALRASVCEQNAPARAKGSMRHARHRPCRYWRLNVD